MQAHDLERLDVGLRALCAREDLGWVLAYVDSANAEGRHESVNSSSSAYHDRGPGWLRGYRYEADASKKPQPEVVTYPLTLAERVLLLVDALLGIYRDLPDLEQAAIRTLGHGWDGRAQLPETITVTEAGPDAPGGFSLRLEEPQETARRHQVVEELITIRAAVLQ